jgi:hypothetical protein
MTTAFDKNYTNKNIVSQGYETEGGSNVSDFNVPSCSIEDCDKAVYMLFKEKLPLFYTRKNKQHRVPVIFATGERFALLTRKQPLRDESGAIILPLISMSRTSLEQDDSGLVAGELFPNVIKKKLHSSDPKYQSIINQDSIENSLDIAINDLNNEEKNIKTRRQINKKTEKKLLTDLSKRKNIYEIITIPKVKFFKASYEVTIWCNYTQQLNNLQTVVMSGYQDKIKKTFKLETEKGYWFVATVESSFTSQDNFDSFSDEERIVKSSFNLSVPCYVIEPNLVGMPQGVRSFISSPEINFEITEFGNFSSKQNVGTFTSDIDDLVLEDLRTDLDDIQGQSIGGIDSISNLDSRKIKKIKSNIQENTSIGGSSSGNSNLYYDENGNKTLVKYRNNKKGETVLRTLDNI